MKIINKLCAKVVNSNSDDVNETKIPQNSDDGKGLDLESALGLIPGQGPKEKVPDEILIELFKYFFMPNIDFYSEEGNPKYTAYFNVVNAAKYELITQKGLFTEATKWTSDELKELIDNPVPGLTNIKICGLIFLMGRFAVIKDIVYCVDFIQRIPNCITLYLLLIAQKQPKERRTQLLDVGVGVDKREFSDALDKLKVCDPQWDARIL